MRMERLNEMERYILQKGTVSLPELAAHYDVSINTIRRDIGFLMMRGRINKVYGGVSANDLPVALPTQERAGKNVDEKHIIGKLAAELVSDNSAIYLDSGSTVPCIIPYLSEKENVTIVTGSLPALYEAAKFPHLRIQALGGQYNHITSSFVGDMDSLLNKIHLQTVFMAASAVSLRWGLGNNTYEEFKLKERIVNQNDRIVLMADHSKFDMVACYAFCKFDKLTAVVTNKRPSKEYTDAMKLSGTELYCP